MKNHFFFFLLSILLIACNKDDNDISNQVGNWTGVETQTISVNGNITSEINVDFSLNLMEGGDGIFNNDFGSDIEVHWVLDEAENEIFIIREIIVVGGDNLLTTTRFTIEKNTSSEQEWTSTISYMNGSNETEEQSVKWVLSK